MTPKGYRTWSHSVLSSVLLLVFFILVNVLCAPSSARVDLTEEGLFTLSDGSREIVSSLRDPMDISVFWGGVPARLEAQRPYIEGLLDEIEDAAEGKITVTWIDVTTDEGKARAGENGVKEYEYTANEGSRMVQQKGYMTLLLETGASDPARIPQLGFIGHKLEYVLLAEIDKRARVSPSRIGVWIPDSPLFLNNSVTGGRNPGRFNLLQGWLQRFHGKNVSPLASLEKPVPADVDVLLVVAPWQVSEISAYHLEQFALRGGRVLLLMDQVNVQNTMIPKQEREPRSSGLEDWLTHLGVTVEYGLVGDFSATNQAVNPFIRGGRGPYPYFPMLTKDNTDEENLVLGSLRAFPMCWPSALTVDEKAQEAAGRTSKVLARTSPSGHRRADIGAVGTTLKFPVPPTRELEHLALIVQIDGPLTSMWKGKERPKSPAELAAEAVKKREEAAAKEAANAAKEREKDGDKPPAPVPGSTEEGEEKKPGNPEPGDPKPSDPKPDEPGGDGGEGDDGAEEDKGPPRLNEGDIKIVIVGDAEMCADYMGPDPRFRGRVPPPNGEGGFLVAAGFTDWLSGSENLLALRAREATPRMLEEVTDEEKKVIQWVNLLAVPLLLLCLGLVVFAVRRSQRS